MCPGAPWRAGSIHDAGNRNGGTDDELLNNPFIVEIMLNEQKVQPREMEMAHAREALRASTGQPTAGRYWRRALGQLGRFLLAISERSSSAPSTEN